MKSSKIAESNQDSEKPIYYLAFGMLTDPDLMPNAKLLGKAALPDFKFELSQFANIVPSGGDTVYGSLWVIDRETLADLDITEGYPNFYDRKVVPVYLKDTKIDAEVYMMTPKTREHLFGASPSKYYIKKVYRGYTHAHIPLSQLTDALNKGNHESN